MVAMKRKYKRKEIENKIRKKWNKKRKEKINKYKTKKKVCTPHAVK
jgi:hypothetical protein